MLLSHHQNAGQNLDIKIEDRLSESVAQFKYLGTTVTNQDLILEAIKRKLNSGNTCYHLLHNILSPCLLSRNVKIRIYKTIILSVALYGFKIWSLIFGLKRDKVLRGWRKLHNEQLCNVYSLRSIIWMIKSRRIRWAEHVARMGGKVESI
jgi:hypothetical protein